MEWILLLSLLAIGIVGGIGAVRQALNSELVDITNAIEELNFKNAAECTAEGAGFPCG